MDKRRRSGNFLHVVDILVDCDRHVLIKVTGRPVCHAAATPADENEEDNMFLKYLQDFICNRKEMLNVFIRHHCSKRC